MLDSSSNEGEPDIFDDDAISQAVAQNDIHTLRQLLERRKGNPLPLAADERGWTALHVAASRPESTECLELLLLQDDGVLELDAETDFGRTALHVACSNGCEESALLLLQKGANMMSTDGDGNLPLHGICERRNLASDCFYQYADLALMNQQNHFGITPFMLSVQNAEPADVRYLLENGARTDIYTDQAKGALHYAAEAGRADVLQLLLEFADLSKYQEFCSKSFPFIGTQSEGRSFASLTCCALQGYGLCLDLLMTCGLPKSILQMPDIRYDGLLVYVDSPLSYLFKCAYTSERFSSYLQLLLHHKVTMVDEFCAQFQVKWPQVDVRFHHPFTNIVFHSMSEIQRQHFESLVANGVTTDYCLQCYHDHTRSVDTFTIYDTYYKPLRCAIEMGNMEIVKLLVSNSVILEPDKLLAYSICSINRRYLEASTVCRYLCSLKPIYCIPELVRSFHLDDGQYLCDLASEEFARVTLQQLCRTAIRQQLRGPSLADDLRNFRRKLSELPLPDLLKDYLLFKN